MSLFTYHTGRLEENSKKQSSEEKKVEEEQKIETHYTWKKGEHIQLSKNFSSLELQCKCRNSDCIDQKINKELIEKAQKVRDDHGNTIIVTSGFRCLKHNKAEGSSDTSQHPLGNGLDYCSSELNELYQLSEKHFNAVGDGRKKGFVHVDSRNDKIRRWNY
jgi:uncharacterized protein YcbK (DUF882 family)